MTAIILFASFIILIFLSVPIGISLGIATLITIVVSETLPLSFLPQALINAVDNFPIMAVPFFILAGEIMGRGGLSQRLFAVANAIVGNKTGGIAIAAIITSMFFSAMSGSAPATVAAVGGLMIPAMIQEGYDRKFATAVIVSAGSLGVIFPPSIPMVVYGVSGGVSIGDLFIAGILPGFLVAFALMVYAFWYSKKMGYKGSGEEVGLKVFGKAAWEAKWGLLVPVIILGGIYGGVFTPTEAAVVAVVYGFFAGVFLYKQLKIKDIPSVISDAALTTATILIIVGAATAFGGLMTVEQMPQQIAAGILSISENPIIVILLITVLLLIVGCFMDTLAAIIILTPLLLPIAVSIGFDPVHFGIIMVINLAIGFITPPVGVNLFVGSGISGLSIEAIAKAVVPFFFAMLISLIVVIFIPQISLLLVPE